MVTESLAADVASPPGRPAPAGSRTSAALGLVATFAFAFAAGLAAGYNKPIMLIAGWVSLSLMWRLGVRRRWPAGQLAVALTSVLAVMAVTAVASGRHLPASAPPVVQQPSPAPAVTA